VLWSRRVRCLAAAGAACLFVTGCSVSVSSPASLPSSAAASGMGSHTASWTRGMLTYWVRWHGTKGGIQIDGLRAKFTTCHHVFFFFTKCQRGLVKPEITFGVYAQAVIGQRDKRLWGQDVSIGSNFRLLSAGGTAWLPTGHRIAMIFPPGSMLGVGLWGYNDWSAVGEGGNQWYRAPNSDGTVFLG
jgi:hypothetical protein